MAAGEEIIVDTLRRSGYFRTLGLPLLNGRDIATTMSRAPPGRGHQRNRGPAVLARTDPIGKHITFFGPGPMGNRPSRSSAW